MTTDEQPQVHITKYMSKEELEKLDNLFFFVTEMDEQLVRAEQGSTKYETWISDVVDRIYYFDVYYRDLNKKYEYEFEYSLETLQDIEKNLIFHFESLENIIEELTEDLETGWTNSWEMLSYFTSYIGDMFAHTFDGEWKDPTVEGTTQTVAPVPYVEINGDGKQTTIVPFDLVMEIITYRNKTVLTNLWNQVEADFNQYQQSLPESRRYNPNKRPEIPTLTDFEKEFLINWLNTMDQSIKDWYDKYVKGAFPLDFTRESLIGYEAFLLDVFKTEEEMDLEENKELLEGAVRYLGEVSVRAGMVRWNYFYDPDYQGEDKYRAMCSGKPYVESPRESHLQTQYPYYTIANIVDKRTGVRAVNKFDHMLKCYEEDGIPFDQLPPLF